MTVAVNTNPRVEYTASAAQTTFTYNFLLLSQSDLVVTVDGVVLTPGVGFTVTALNTPSGGTFILTSALTVGQLVVAYRNTAIQRLTDYQPNGPLTASSLNSELDSQTVASQDIKAESTVGHIRLSQNVSGANIPAIIQTPSQRSNKILAFDEAGNPVAVSNIGTNRGDWMPSTLYFERDLVRDPATLNVYQVKVEYTSGLAINLDNLDLVLDATVRRLTESTVIKTSSFTPNLTQGTIFLVSGTATVTMPTAVMGSSFTLIATTGDTITWSGVLWTQGNEPIKGSGIDIYSFISDGTNWYGGQAGTNYAT